MIRIGNSVDIHKFCSDKKLILGGVEVNYEYGLQGHSDADVVLHSVCEAIIGALALGDIGEHFPDTDPKYKGIDSSLLLIEVVKLMNDQCYEIGNVDITILCEKPHLKAYKEDIQVNIARLLNTSVGNVNVKATRGEKMGFIGRAEGIASLCTLIIRKLEEIWWESF